MSVVGSIVNGVLGSNAATGAAGALEQGAQSAQALELQNQNAALGQQQTALSNVTSAEQPYQAEGSTGANAVAGYIANGGFTAPTLKQAEATPGYQFAQQQGTQAIDANAAANGTLMSGTTGTALENYGQNLAQNAYQQTYNNALNAYQTNVSTAQGAANTGLTSTGQLANTNLGISGQTTQTDLTAAQQQALQINNAAQAKAGGIIGSSNAIQGVINGVSGDVNAGASSLAENSNMPAWATLGLGL